MLALQAEAAQSGGSFRDVHLGRERQRSCARVIGRAAGRAARPPVPDFRGNRAASHAYGNPGRARLGGHRLPVQAQTYSAEELNRRMIEQRAVEAGIWGMPATKTLVPSPLVRPPTTVQSNAVMSAIPLATIPDAATRSCQGRSFIRTVPIRAAMMTLVSRRAETMAIGANA
jgi:hypothetical protein